MDHSISRGKLWTGRILSAVAILFMLFDSITKLIKTSVVVESTVELGYGEHHIVALGVLGLAATLLYAFPRTSALGAVLLTGYFGGAIATHVRLDSPLFTHILFPVYLGLFVWIGLGLRNEAIRRLFSFTKAE